MLLQCGNHSEALTEADHKIAQAISQMHLHDWGDGVCQAFDAFATSLCVTDLVWPSQLPNFPVIHATSVLLCFMTM